MSGQRPTLIVLSAFAVALAALVVAGVSAWVRCGRGSECSTELGLAIVAFAPAALIGILVLLLMRIRADIRWLRNLLLAAGVGVAVLPLAAFLLRDVLFLSAFAALVALLFFLVLWGEEHITDAAPEGLPSEIEPEAEEHAPEAHPQAPPVERDFRLPAGPRAERALILLEHLAVLNDDVLRLCEALPRLSQRRQHAATAGRPDDMSEPALFRSYGDE